MVTAGDSLSLRMASRLRRLISNLKPGDRLPAETALVAELGGSLTKVREALTLLVQEGLIERRQGSGTYALDTRQTRAVGIFSSLDLTHPHSGLFFRVLTHELREFFAREGQATRLYLGHSRPGDTAAAVCDPILQHDLKHHQLSGVIALTGTRSAEWLEPQCERAGVPLVGRTSDYAHACIVPHQEMLKVAAHYLHDRGCRRLALLGWEEEHHPGGAPHDLVDEMRAWLPDHVIMPDAWVRTDLHPAWPGAGWEELREIWMSRRDKPDGLIVADDNLLLDVATALGEIGIGVPEDLQVVAKSSARVTPTMPFPHARVEIDPRICAEIMGQMLLQLQDRPSRRRLHTEAEFHLIVPTDQGTRHRSVHNRSSQEVR